MKLHILSQIEVFMRPGLLRQLLVPQQHQKNKIVPIRSCCRKATASSSEKTIYIVFNSKLCPMLQLSLDYIAITH